MINKFLKKTILIGIGLIACISWANSRDYYVRNGTSIGDGSGSDAQNAASYSMLSNTLQAHTVSAYGNTLNVFFESSAIPYGVGSSPFIFSTIANVDGLTVSFQPADPDATRGDVIFDGANTNICFIRTTSGSNMSVSVSKVTIQNFKNTSGVSNNGTNSLFANGITDATQTSISLSDVHIKDISALRSPLIAINSGLFNVAHSLIENVSVTRGSYGPLIESTAAMISSVLNFTSTTFDNCSSNAILGYEHMFYLAGIGNSLILSDVTIQNCNFPRSLIYTAIASSYIDVRNSKFINNKNANSSVTAATPIIAHILAANAFNVIDCEFSENISSRNYPMIFILDGAPIEMGGCTFFNNSFSTIADYTDILRLTGTTGKKLVYNNTFSGNSVQNTIHIAMSNTSSAIFNNTFYNSGGISKENFIFSVMNNLLLGTNARIVTGTSGVNSTQRNVIGNAFYATGASTVSENIPNAIDYLTTLTDNPNNTNAPKVHLFAYPSGTANPFTKLGGYPSLTGYADLLKFDQIGRTRPELISVGSIDDPDFTLPHKSFTFVYDPNLPWDPSNTLEINLYDMGLPEGADPATNITYTMNSIGNGTLTQRQGYPYIFDFYPLEDPNDPGYPVPGIVGNAQTTTYEVSYTNTTTGAVYTATGSFRIYIMSTDAPPMGNLSDQDITCITEFSTVNFASKYKFITGLESGTSLVDPGTGQPISASNNSANNMDAFSIPLVGDLNGDGKPEIVILSHDNVSTAYAQTKHLYIINGQTGRIIIKHALPVQMNTRGGDTYHGTPSAIALVDSDRDGLGEIIVAMGYHKEGSSNNYDKRLISYEVNERTFESEFAITRTSATDPARLTMKWVSDKRYDWVENPAGTNTTRCNFNFTATNGQVITDTEGYCFDSNIYFSTPLPQIVDFNGNGKAEIFVYNKIYDAETGKLIMALEELGPATNLASYKNTTYDDIRGYAFVGRGRTAQSDGGSPTLTGSDTNVPYAYIYDLDGDGKYDVAAGGKVYYNMDLDAKTYDVLGGKASSESDALVLGDGYTGVADVNSDGIPEVVVLTRTPGNASASSPLILTVWDPGFKKIDAQGNIVAGDKIPRIIAKRTIPIEYTTYGNHSYLYIGDLDGLEQEVSAPGGGNCKEKVS